MEKKYIIPVIFILIFCFFISNLLSQDQVSIIDEIKEEYLRSNNLITSAIVEYTIDQRFTTDGQKAYEYYVLDPKTASQSKEVWAKVGFFTFHKEYFFMLDKNKKYEKVLTIPHVESLSNASEITRLSNGNETLYYKTGSKHATRISDDYGFGGEISGPINYINFGRIIANYGNFATNEIFPELIDIRFIESVTIEGNEYYWIEGKGKYEKIDSPITYKALLDPSKGYLAKRIEKIDTSTQDTIPYSITLDFIDYRSVTLSNGKPIWIADTIILKNSYMPNKNGKIISITEQEIKLKNIQLNVPIPSTEMNIELPEGVEIRYSKIKS